MEKTMKELAKDPSSIQITNVETMFSNDSICILHFKFTGKNGFGGVSSDEMEYIYLKTYDSEKKIVYKETAFKLDDTESILSKARDSYREKKWDSIWDVNKSEKKSDEDKKAWYIYFEASFYMIFNSREVGNTKPTKYDTDKW